MLMILQQEVTEKPKESDSISVMGNLELIN